MSRVNIAELRRLHEAAMQETSIPQDLRKSMNTAQLALPALLDELEAAREALSQIYWKSIELGEDRGDSTINHIAADALKGDTSPLHARDRRMKAIGAAEELERLANNTSEVREMYLTEQFYGLRAFSHELLSKSMKDRAAQLRREAEG